MKIKVIIPFYGRFDDIDYCLSNLISIVNQEDIIIIDNNNEEINQELINKIPRAIIIYNKKNLGYAGGVNQGLQEAIHSSATHLLILTQDTIIRNVEALYNYAINNSIDICGVKILDENKKIWFDGGEVDKYRYTAGHKIGKLDYISGCCMLVRKDVFEKVGYFDEQYFMYYEDVDFCVRASLHGFKLGIADDVIAVHDTHKTIEKNRNMEYYLARNHFLFLHKHAPLLIRAREYIRLPKTIYEHITRKEYDALQGIRDSFINMYSKR